MIYTDLDCDYPYCTPNINIFKNMLKVSELILKNYQIVRYGKILIINLKQNTELHGLDSQRKHIEGLMSEKICTYKFEAQIYLYSYLTA